MLENQNEIKQELFILRTNQDKCTKSEHAAPPSTSLPTSTTPPQTSTTVNSSPNTLFIGDSISSNVHLDVLEEATQTKFKTAKAYTSIYDTVKNVAKQPARFPSSNFTEVVPIELNKGKFQTLILQAGSVNITNMNTKDNPEAHIEYFRQETIKSATNFLLAYISKD